MNKTFNSPDRDIANGVRSCHAVVASGVTTPLWFSKSKTCPLLDTHLIKHCGFVSARSPFHIVRTNCSGGYCLSCHEGQGEINFEGSTRLLKAGEACLLSPHTRNSLNITKGQIWSFSWVRFHESDGNRPDPIPKQPVFAAFPSLTFRSALEGLIEECQNPTPSTSDLHHWIELINSHDSRGRRDELGVRVGPLWAGNRHRISKRKDHSSRRKTWHSPKLGPQRTENSSTPFIPSL